jgi:hypothetical protein
VSKDTDLAEFDADPARRVPTGLALKHSHVSKENAVNSLNNRYLFYIYCSFKDAGRISF